MQVSDCDTSAGTTNGGGSSESGIHSPEQIVNAKRKKRKSKLVPSEPPGDANTTIDASPRIDSSQSPALKSSTPRRRKNMLAQLASSLSPKYIGYVSSEKEDESGSGGIKRTRYLRRRKLSRDTDKLQANNNNNESSAAEITATSTHVLDATAGNEADSNSPQATEEPLPQEEVAASQQIDDLPETNATQADDLAPTDETPTMGAAETEQQQQPQSVEHFTPAGEETSAELPPPEDNDFSPEVENLTGATISTSDKTAASCSSDEAKSPSAMSTDSAKGSSIFNGHSWPPCQTGDLFWGRLFSYCYWPCMVSPDADGLTVRSSGDASQEDELVHVRFFGDNGRRNWVNRKNLIPYNGYAEYKKHIVELSERYGKNSPKFKVLFLPKQRQKKLWHAAIHEADVVDQTDYPERLEKFNLITESVRQARLEEKLRRASEDSNMESTRYDRMYPMKRERSSSPCSPAFSPIKSANAAKRFKVSSEQLNYSGSSEVYASTTSLATMSQAGDEVDSELLLNPEFFKLYAIMHDWVFEGTAPVSGATRHPELIDALGKVWQLKLHHMKRMTTSGEDGRLTRSTTRLTERLKVMQQPENATATTEEPESTANSGSEQGKRRGEYKRQPRRPIEEVIDDIFSQDKKILFRGMSRDPLCRYCLKAGADVKKCSKGNCQTWLHPECLAVKAKDSIERRKSFDSSKPVVNSLLQRLMKPRRASMYMEPGHGPPMGMLTPPPEPTTINIKEEPAEVSPDSVPKEDEHLPPTVETLVVCRECSLPPQCTLCERAEPLEGDNRLTACGMAQCNKYYHEACCKHWPQARFDKSQRTMRCPSHVCHTCVSPDPRHIFQNLPYSKMVRCVRCPATYHADSSCIPAGTQILNAAHVICPRHNLSKADASVNVGWCFICVGGGNLISCAQCPTTVHEFCVHFNEDKEKVYICDDCESGRLPMAGDIVWGKFKVFRWWPAIVLPPSQVPDNIQRLKHQPNEFVVRFLGTHDHGWISKRRVYHFVDGDSVRGSRNKKILDQNYVRGVEEAKRFYHIVKQKKEELKARNRLKTARQPQPYKRIKNNIAVPPLKLHTDIEAVNKCECLPSDEHPCGLDSNCLNRMLLHECNPKICPAGARCENQMFEAHKSPNLEIVFMEERGFGIVCREPIREGSFIIEYVGEVINQRELQTRIKDKNSRFDDNFYFLCVENNYIIDAEPKGNEARFINHSCDPNCETQKWSVNGLNRVGVFAIQDIPENTELTFNYYWNDLFDAAKLPCYCGTSKCTGKIGGKLKEEKTKPSKVPEVEKKVRAPKKPLKRLTNKKPAGESLTSAGATKDKKLTKIKLSGDSAKRSTKPIGIKINAKPLSTKRKGKGSGVLLDTNHNHNGSDSSSPAET